MTDPHATPGSPQPLALSTTLLFRAADDVRIDPAAWEARVRETAEELAADGLEPDVLADALRELRLVDEAGNVWVHDGSAWRTWAPPGSAPARPLGSLRLEPFAMELVTAPADLASGEEPYEPTDLVPAVGMAAWSEPDPAAAPVATLDPGLDVMVVDERDDGWAQVRCSNGWIAWVDGRLLEPL